MMITDVSQQVSFNRFEKIQLLSIAPCQLLLLRVCCFESAERMQSLCRTRLERSMKTQARQTEDAGSPGELWGTRNRQRGHKMLLVNHGQTSYFWRKGERRQKDRERRGGEEGVTPVLAWSESLYANSSVERCSSQSS